jgi:hypothetical protein
MARKTKEVTIPDDGGRDAGKTFILTELPASQAEKWAARVWLGLARSGSSFRPTEEDAASGLAGVATALVRQGVSLFSNMQWHDFEPLMDEMWQCVRIKDVLPGGKPNVRQIYEDHDIEELATRLLLRMEVLKLHVDFFPAVSRLKSIWATVTAGI